MSYKIPYESEKHTKILTALNARLDFSRLRMSDFHDKWRRSEEAELAYMQAKDVDLARKGARDAGDPQYTTLVIPYNYAILQSAHTYWSSVFLSRSPVFQYQGRHGETDQQKECVESLMDYQLLVGEWLVPLYIWLHDVGKYGVGVLWSYWDEQEETVSRIVRGPKEFLGIPIPGTETTRRETQTIPGYQGNKLFNVRPYDFFPDPRVPMWDHQRGEFVGRIYDMGSNEMKQGGESGRFFNLENVPKNGQRDTDRDASSQQMNMPFDYIKAEGYPLDDFDQGYNEMLDMVVEISPSEWDLGGKKTLEKWAFTVSNRQVIIGAQPLGEWHNKFPTHVLQYEIEGYQVLARSLYDIMQPLNDTMTWLVNSHFYNVRAALNDQFVVDPSRVEMTDVQDPGPGRIWRLKPTAYGTDPAKAYSQMRVADVTQQHMPNIDYIAQLIQRISGASDPIMGQGLPSGRRSATEFRGSSTMSANRLKTQAEWFSAMGWSPMSRILLQRTQQMYDSTKQFRLVGDQAIGSFGTRQISPEDIQGFFDFIPVDGSQPIDKMAMGSLWREIMSEMQKMPQLMAQYDIGKIFEYVAQLVGLRSIKQFKIKIEQAEEIQRQAQAGNIIPLGGQGGQGPGGATQRSRQGPGGTPRLPTPAQVPGVGPVA